MEKKRFKVKMKTGSIYTIEISEQTNEYIQGVDKYGDFVKLALDDIESMSRLFRNKEW